MYKIGEFSIITKISSRMLRYYDKENILKPSFIGNNGYRFYTDKDLDSISKIKNLRRYDFSYTEIKDILKCNLDQNPNTYTNKINELKNNINKYDILISELESKTNKREALIYNNYDINLCNKKPYYSLCKKKTLSINDLDKYIETSVSNILKSNADILGSYYILFCENESSKEDILEVEYHQPIKNYKEIHGFETKYINNGLYISTLHYGSYHKLDRAYSELYKWSKKNNYIITGSFMEKYLVDSSLTLCESNFITEISVKILSI